MEEYLKKIQKLFCSVRRASSFSYKLVRPTIEEKDRDYCEFKLFDFILNIS